MTRIGIFGGAFDPPHIAHIALARAAVAQFHLDELRIIPTGSAWHKSRPLSSGTHRLAMAHLAFDEIDKVHVDSREIDRDGPTYTVDTLTALKTEHPQAVFYVFIGEDQALAFKTWYQWPAILDVARVVVAQRAGLSNAEKFSRVAQWHNGVSANVQSLDLPPMAVSATEIRSRLANAAPMPPWLPASVQRYIDQHRLYPTLAND